jgi:hypothetical protein
MLEMEDVHHRLMITAPLRDVGRRLFVGLRRRTKMPARRSVLALAISATVLAASGWTSNAVAFGSTHATTVVDKTISCPLRTSLASAGFTVGAAINGPYGGGVTVTGAGYVLYAGAGKPQMLVSGPGTKPVKTGYYTSGACASSHTRIPLTASRLPSLGIFSAAGNADIRENCSVPSNSTITVRLRVILAKPGVAASAQLAISGGRRPHPIAFVSWTPTRFRAYVTPGCEQS